MGPICEAEQTIPSADVVSYNKRKHQWPQLVAYVKVVLAYRSLSVLYAALCICALSKLLLSSIRPADQPTKSLCYYGTFAVRPATFPNYTRCPEKGIQSHTFCVQAYICMCDDGGHFSIVFPARLYIVALSGVKAQLLWFKSRHLSDNYKTSH